MDAVLQREANNTGAATTYQRLRVSSLGRQAVTDYRSVDATAVCWANGELWAANATDIIGGASLPCFPTLSLDPGELLMAWGNATKPRIAGLGRRRTKDLRVSLVHLGMLKDVPALTRLARLPAAVVGRMRSSFALTRDGVWLQPGPGYGTPDHVKSQLLLSGLLESAAGGRTGREGAVCSAAVMRAYLAALPQYVFPRHRPSELHGEIDTNCTGADEHSVLRLAMANGTDDRPGWLQGADTDITTSGVMADKLA